MFPISCFYENMRITLRYIIACLCSIVLFYSCSNDDDTEEDVYFNLSSSTVTVSSENSVREISIETNSAWNIPSELPGWLSITPKSGSAGQFAIQLHISRNESAEPRSCDIIFSYADDRKTLSVAQKAVENLRFSSKDYQIEAEDTVLTIGVERNVGYGIELIHGSDAWAEVEDYSGNAEGTVADDIWAKDFKLHIKENLTGEVRNTCIVIYNKHYELSDTLCVAQKGGIKIHYDGAWEQLQAAQSGSVNLIVMGDGFIRKDMTLGGTYEQVMRQAVDNFFSIEPYTTYRNYFNVYMVAAESEEAGVGEKGGVKSVRNKFGTAFGSGTEIVCNSDLILEYARKVEELPSDRPLSVIVVLNSTKYAGTTYMYSNGNSIALCPMSAKDSPNDFEGLVHHEAGGHGFGFLCDEYIYYDRNIPEDEKRNIKEWQKLGFQMNLDFTDNLSAILWKDFIGQPGYEPVGAFEGGSQYQYGVWRPEKNSCMNNNIPYFNVQSRWNIVRRIMKLSGMDISVREFMEKDKPVYPSEAVITRAASDFIPLGNPVWIK